ncbi:sodium/myo-inositol cotransporter-like isoform X2 [Dermatophagoides pteronyssinus]|uniref:sodium/myo-inositol cotransporter-like isoform X2 n=1 Tax=Dermatophagoides pteronyssinus TaxID=6956 RepID=UPI003F661CA1
MAIGAAAGISVVAFEINALLILQLCGWIFIPVFIASKVCTLPGYISKRFGSHRIQIYLAVLSMLLYIFTKISVNLFSGAIFIQQTIGWDIYWSILLLLSITSICTITGGLGAVMWTETAQSIIMIFGSGTLTYLALQKIGGFKNLYHEYMNSRPSIIPNNMSECASPNPRSFLLLRPLNDPDMPWLGFIFGQTTASIWYWCTDQMMVQRLLAAKSLSHSQGGALFAGYLKLLPFFLIILPGMISRILYTDQVACVDPVECFKHCQNRHSCTNVAYPRLVLGVMPSPLKGLMMSVMLAALMSDLSSVFNSSSTLFTCDIWPLFRKNASVMELMIVGRTFVIFMIVVSIAWIPIIQSMQNGQLYLYIQDVAANLAPPIAAVYIMAVLFKRVNESGAFWALMTGLIIGLLRMGLNLHYMEPTCGQFDLRPWIAKVHYMYYAIFVFWITVAFCVIISLCTDPPEDYLLIRTTYWSRFDKRERTDEREEEMQWEMLETDNNRNNKKQNHNHSNHIIAIDSYSQELQTKQQPIKSSNNNPLCILRRFIIWFCGIEPESQKQNNRKKKSNNEKHKLVSIEQDVQAKKILTSALIIIVCLALFIFIFFSIPNWWQFIFTDWKISINE